MESGIKMRSTATLAALSFGQVYCIEGISCRCQTETESAALAGLPLAPNRERCLIKRFYKLNVKRLYFSWSSPVEGDGAS